MTKTFKTNDANDLYLGPDGNLVVVLDQEAVMQACENAAKSQLGEMMFQTEDGVPNFQTIWVGSPNIAQFEAALRRTLEQVDGVKEVAELSASVANNVLTYTASIITDYGAGVING